MKKIYILFSLLCLSFLAFSQQTINGAITHGGVTRTYILYVPANYTGTAAVPLVLNFHGYSSNATEQMFYGSFRSIADTVGFLVVHPQGTLDNTNTAHFNVGWGTSTVDDVSFTSDLLDTLIANYNINTDRVYSTGMSNGGFMSYNLACNLSSRIAAIASVTGSMSPLQYNSCSPSHPTPILEIHGDADAVVPYNGAIHATAISNVLQYWVTYNNCNATSTTTSIADANTADNSTVDHVVYSGGTNGVNVEHFKINNGGHTWAGSAFNFAGTNYDIDASAEIWEFFSRYDINGLITTTNTNTVEVQSLKVYPNPATSFIRIAYDFSEKVNYQLVSTLGEIVKTGILNNEQEDINISDLVAGVYFLRIENQVVKIVKSR